MCSGDEEKGREEGEGGYRGLSIFFFIKNGFSLCVF